MANIKSAIKRVKTSNAAGEKNIAQKNQMRTAVKTAQAAKAEGADNAEELVNVAFKHIDKAAKKNLVHKNKASRMKSQLSK